MRKKRSMPKDVSHQVIWIFFVHDSSVNCMFTTFFFALPEEVFSQIKLRVLIV